MHILVWMPTMTLNCKNLIFDAKVAASHWFVPVSAVKENNSRLDFSFQLKPTSNFFIPFPKFVARKVSHVVWNRNASFSFFSVRQQPSTFFSFQLFSLLLWNWVSFNLIRTIVGGDFRGRDQIFDEKIVTKIFFCHLSNWPTSKLFWERL